MTTTLRPTGPERRAGDGTRARSFDVRVNGRPVGSVRLAADRSAGRIEGLAVDEPERRRGRATVAVLAAEEVLRDWGCRSVEASIPAAASAALRLAAALGYTEHGRGLAKELSSPPPELPEGTTVRPAGPADGAGGSAPAAPLTDRARTAGAVLHVLAHGGRDVGRLWSVPPGTAPGASGAHRVHGALRILRVEVDPAHRGRGHGRSLLLAAERTCLAAGAHALVLDVPAAAPVLRLCASLGYRPTVHHLRKPLL